MARTAILFGLLLVGVTLATIGVNGGFRSVTVFIPSILGVLIAGLGAIALKDHLRKHAMHAASAIGLLGGVACLGMGIKQLAKIGTETQPSASQFGSVWSTAILCLVFVFLCVQSFIRAKRERLASKG
jgi:hypothetical protein